MRSTKDLVSLSAVAAIGAVSVPILLGAASPLALRPDGIVFPDGTIQTTAATNDTRRAFYLTNSSWDGASALSACTEGFHMASQWEILDVSNLRYAHEITDSSSNSDAGTGPPSDAPGWIRTGDNSGNAATAGGGNCNLWTNNSPEDHGTLTILENAWDGDQLNPPDVDWLGPWDPEPASCDNSLHVWCIQD